MKPARNNSDSSSRVYHYERNHCEIETLVHQDSEEREVKMKTSWRRKNGCWYILLVALLFLMLLICITLIVLLYKIPEDGKRKSSLSLQACQTLGCLRVAGKLLQSVNFSADPCENFYDFACGGWRSHYTIPAEKEKWDTFEALEERKKLIVKSMIAETDKDPKRHYEAASKLVNFYGSCNNIDDINKAGKKPLKDLIQSLGFWPILDSQWNYSWDLTSALALVHNQFFSSVHHTLPAPLFNSYVKVDDLNSSRHIMELNQADLPLVTKDDYSQNSTRMIKIKRLYKRLMWKLFNLIGANITSDSKELDDIFELETNLAKVSLPTVLSRDVRKSYRKMTLGRFIKDVGTEIDWLRYLNKVSEEIGVKFTASTTIGVRNMDYLKALNNILKVTDKRTVANYIVWIVIFRLSNHLSSDFRKVNFEFQKEMKGFTKDIELWKKCVYVVEEKMSLAVTALFIQKAFQGQEKALAEEMLERMKKQLITNIKSSEWMDKPTQKAAEEKARKMLGNIGYPSEVKNKTFLNHLYKKIFIDRRKYFENLMNASKFQREDNLLLLKKPVNRQLWDLAPTFVDAYYDVTNNKMVFLGGIMGPPIFDLEAPMSLNFGAFGAVMGHEMTHGFDDQGRLYNSNGNLKDWWTNKSNEAFKKRARCIADQYSNYESYGLKINGNQTLGENIADNGGVLTAFKAYQAWVAERGEERVLPAFNLTQNQLFFLSSGQVWCGLYRKAKVQAGIKNGVHSPSRWRVTGPLSNIKEFAEAYKCPIGSPMNPAKKCRVW